MLKKLLRDRCGFNLRERASIYSGIFVGAVIPIAAYRYACFKSESNSVLEELGKWTLATVVSTPSNLIGAYIGFHAGFMTSLSLRHERRFSGTYQESHEYNLEENVNDSEKLIIP